MFKTETHLHTAEVSPCGKVNAKELMELYAERGFSTVFVTDHIYKRIFDGFGEISWEEKVDRFLSGYLSAREAGERLGINVILAAEVCFTRPEGNYNDYLLYGIDRDFLVGMPDLYDGFFEELLPIIRSKGVTVIQAHPYRNGKCTPTPGLVDGLEVFNGNPRHTNYNADAARLAHKCGLLASVGSDTHQYVDIARAYIETEGMISTSSDYISALKSGCVKFVTVGE